jgi:predicted Fe-Mo cluster-binding NifX family protein
MRVALPLFGTEVAPRFAHASELLVVEIEGGQEVSRQVLSMRALDWHQRVQLLSRLGVSVVLAGGFNRCLWPVARASGLRVYWGQCGEAGAVLAAFVRGELQDPAQPEPPPGGGPRQRCRRRGRRGR